MSRNYSNDELSLQLETVVTPRHTPDVMKIRPYDDKKLQSIGAAVVTIKCLRITAIYVYPDL